MTANVLCIVLWSEDYKLALCFFVPLLIFIFPCVLTFPTLFCNLQKSSANNLFSVISRASIFVLPPST